MIPLGRSRGQAIPGRRHRTMVRAEPLQASVSVQQANFTGRRFLFRLLHAPATRVESIGIN